MSDLAALCVYCGSSNDVSPAHLEAAAALGRQAAERGVSIVYGGGRVGLMGALGEAALLGGGHVVGVIPQFLEDLEVGDARASEYLVVDSMHTRKNLMFDRSDAFCSLPGGLGTLDETFEIITWKQLRLHDKPIVLVNLEGYWDPLLAMLEHQLAAGYMRPAARQLFTVVETVQEVFEVIAAAAPPALPDESARL